MDLHGALYTTRDVRCRRNPVPGDLKARILAAVIRAPSEGKVQPWRLGLVDAQEFHVPAAAAFRSAISERRESAYATQLAVVTVDRKAPDSAVPEPHWRSP